MGLSNLNALSIAELVIYAPLTVIACAVSIRHGFHPLKGWIFLFIFCALHIVGAALNLATISSPMVIAFVTVPIELFAIGQVVIIYVILGVLARVADSINKERPTTLKALYIHLVRIPFIAGIILVIIGTDASNATWSTTGIYPINELTKIGFIIFIATFAVLVLMVFVFMPRRSQAEAPSRLLYDIIIASLPFMLVRIIYSLLITFVDNAAFNPITGNVAARGFLATVEEMIITILYIYVGLKLPKLPKEVVVQTSE